MSRFPEPGIQMESGCDIQILKRPVSGQETFMNDLHDLEKEKF